MQEYRKTIATALLYAAHTHRLPEGTVVALLKEGPDDADALVRLLGLLLQQGRAVQAQHLYGQMKGRVSPERLPSVIAIGRQFGYETE